MPALLTPRFDVSASPCTDDEEAAEEARKQAQREQDQQEKEEFEARLRARDEEKTRKLMEARLSKEEMEVTPAPMRFTPLRLADLQATRPRC